MGEDQGAASRLVALPEEAPRREHELPVPLDCEHLAPFRHRLRHEDRGVPEKRPHLQSERGEQVSGRFVMKSAHSNSGSGRRASRTRRGLCSRIKSCRIAPFFGPTIGSWSCAPDDDTARPLLATASSDRRWHRPRHSVDVRATWAPQRSRRFTIHLSSTCFRREDLLPSGAVYACAGRGGARQTECAAGACSECSSRRGWRRQAVENAGPAPPLSRRS